MRDAVGPPVSDHQLINRSTRFEPTKHPLVLIDVKHRHGFPQRVPLLLPLLNPRSLSRARRLCYPPPFVFLAARYARRCSIGFVYPFAHDAGTVRSVRVLIRVVRVAHLKQFRGLKEIVSCELFRSFRPSFFPLLSIFLAGVVLFLSTITRLLRIRLPAIHVHD